MPDHNLKIVGSFPFRFTNWMVAFFLSIFFTAIVFAQSPIIFEKLSQENGLSQNSVYSILQDSRGFMWFGTEDGLNRYDGYYFTIYKHDPQNPESLSNNTVRAIYEDHLGTLWFGTYNGLNQLDQKTETFTHFQNHPDQSGSLSGNRIYSIHEDQSGVLWVGTEEGLNRFNRESMTFTRYQHDANNPNSLSGEAVYSIYEDHLGMLWVGTYGGGLNRFDRESETFTHFQHELDKIATLSHDAVYSIFEDRSGVLWLGTYGGGLNRFDRKSETFTHFQHEPDRPKTLSGNTVLSIYEDRSGLLWIGTRAGLNRFDRESETFSHYLHDPSDHRSLSDNIVYSIYEDQSGLLWVGTYNGGLNQIDRARANFAHYQHDPNNPQSLSDNGIRAIYEDRSNMLWIGTIDGGLNQFDRETGTSTHYQHDPNNPNSLGNNGVRSLFEDRAGVLWIGTIGGLGRFDRETKIFTHYQHDPNNLQSLSHDFVRSIYEDQFGLFWIGTVDGLNQFDRETATFSHFKHNPNKTGSLSNNSIYSMYEDQPGTLWIGTNGGLNQFKRETKSFTSYQHEPANPQSLSDNGIRSIHEDRSGTLWIGTSAGLNCFDRSNGAFKQYREKDGLPNDVIYGIVEDDGSNLWMSTNMGISKFNPKKEVFKNYDVNDGLQNNEFNGGAFCKSRSGAILFGGINGFNLFYPDSIRDNPYAPPVVFTAFRRYNTEEAGGKPIEEKGISEKGAITLSYQDNILIFEFAALNFTKAIKNQYTYQMIGLDDIWIELGTEHKVTFTNLSPGEYTLRIKGSNNDGIWNPTPTELKITILPPWWKTWWAYLSYTLLFFGSLYAIYRFQLQRKLAQEEARRLRDIDHLKSQLYANITHEFRTPLTVISGMSNEIGELLQKRAYGKIGEAATLIDRNSNNLLNLINQLLDLAKLESGKLKLNMVHGNIVQYLHFLTESFQSYAESKNIKLTFYSEIRELHMDYDPDKLLVIVSNLITNALKFTNENGKVILHINAFKEDTWPSLILKVKDTGIGIDENSLPNIFDRFYQVDASVTRQAQGTGIGLALTKELVQLMGGEIKVKSRVGEGTEFFVAIPATKGEGIPAIAIEDAIHLKEKTRAFLPAAVRPKSVDIPIPANGEKPMVLLVEDSPDIVIYLKTCLQNDYQLAVANNGEEGIEKAIELTPDIIVSDVMMPKKDGFELCDTLKKHPFTSHIPIVLLTAKATVEDRLTGLEHGADAYLQKPFNKKELLVRLRKLVENRKNLQTYFLSFDKQMPAKEKAIQVEDEFLQKIRKAVEAHLDDPDFDTTQLYREMGMSRSQIYRKLMALTNRSTSHFIRSIRLNKAKELLVNGDFTVAEVAYEVGFKDPSYFSRTFIEEFGIPPSATRKQL